MLIIEYFLNLMTIDNKIQFISYLPLCYLNNLSICKDKLYSIIKIALSVVLLIDGELK